MSLHNQNFIKLSLYKSKIVDSSSVGNNDINNISKQTIKDIGPYKLTITFNNQTSVTDKIQTNQIEYGGGKCFYFGVPENLNEDIPLQISAIGTSWMFFNSPLCSISIPYLSNIGNFIDQKQWYHLKNSKNETIISIFASIWCEYSLNNINNNDTILSNLNLSILNKTYNTNSININQKIINNISRININHLFNNTTSNNIVRRFYTNNNPLCDYNNSTLINESSNANCSSLPNADRANSSLILNNATTEGGKDLSGLLDVYLKQNENSYDKETYTNLKTQIKTLKEKEDKLKEQQKKNKEKKQKLKLRETEIYIEKEKLEEKIRLFKKSRNDFEKKSKHYTYIFTSEQKRYYKQREIDENNKQIFYNLNYFLQTGQDLPYENSSLTESKEANNILSFNNNSVSFSFGKNEKREQKRKKLKTSEIIMDTDDTIHLSTQRKIKYKKRKALQFCEKENTLKSNVNPPKSEINLNIQTPKNDKPTEKRVNDNLESSNQIKKQNQNIIVANIGKDNRKGKVIKRNLNDNLSIVSMVKNKVNISTSIGKTFSFYLKHNISTPKSTMVFHSKREYSLSNNKTNSHCKINKKNHKVFASRRICKQI